MNKANHRALKSQRLLLTYGSHFICQHETNKVNVPMQRSPRDPTACPVPQKKSQDGDRGHHSRGPSGEGEFITLRYHIIVQL